MRQGTVYGVMPPTCCHCESILQSGNKAGKKMGRGRKIVKTEQPSPCLSVTMNRWSGGDTGPLLEICLS